VSDEDHYDFRDFDKDYHMELRKNNKEESNFISDDDDDDFDLKNDFLKDI
jgi:hypothetical protein